MNGNGLDGYASTTTGRVYNIILTDLDIMALGKGDDLREN